MQEIKSLDELKQCLIAIEQKERVKTYSMNPKVGELHGKKIVIYGAGALGHEIYTTLIREGVEVLCFCSGMENGYVDSATLLQVIAPDNLVDYGDAHVIMAIGDAATYEEKKKIKNNLVAVGVSEEHILNHSLLDIKNLPSVYLESWDIIEDVFNSFADDESRFVFVEKIKYMVMEYSISFCSAEKMYVDDMILFKNDECVIDAGAYNGDTAILFRNVIGDCANIYSFEPDRNNFKKLVNRVASDDKIKTINKGLWSETTSLFFSDEATGSSHIQGDSGSVIEVEGLDEFCLNEKIRPTYIKMDIEGAEYEAILGASRVIKEYSPKLAICVYHKPEDIFVLPKLIASIQPHYKLYLRHYSDYRTDTVLYAVR